MKQFKAGVLTISDSAYKGQRTDNSGSIVEKVATNNKLHVVKKLIISDDLNGIKNTLIEWSDNGEIDIILTTGGTGLGPRDVTPDATKAIIDIEIPGLGEIMRSTTFVLTPFAILSRATSGIRSGCLIVNLPGSPKGAKECLESIAITLNHALEMIRGWRTHKEE